MNQKNLWSGRLRNYPDILDVEQICEILNSSTKTGYQLLKTGRIYNLKVAVTKNLHHGQHRRKAATHFEPQKP